MIECDWVELTCGQGSAARFVFECTVLGDIVEMQSGWAIVQVRVAIHTLCIRGLTRKENKKSREKNYQFEYANKSS